MQTTLLPTATRPASRAAEVETKIMVATAGALKHPQARPTHIRLATIDGEVHAFRRYGLLGREAEIGTCKARAMVRAGEALPLPSHPRRCQNALFFARDLLERGRSVMQATTEAGIAHGITAADYRYFRDGVERMAVNLGFVPTPAGWGEEAGA